MGRRSAAALVLALLAADGLVAQPQPQPPHTVFRANTALVSVDVVVRDNAGSVVRGSPSCTVGSVRPPSSISDVIGVMSPDCTSPGPQLGASSGPVHRLVSV